MRSSVRCLLAVTSFASALLIPLSASAAHADIILPGDPVLLGDVQTVDVQPPDNNTYTCKLAVTRAYSERGSDGFFRIAGDGVSSCPPASVSMELRTELHFYSSATARSGSQFGYSDYTTSPTGTTIKAHGYGRTSNAGYIRVIGQSRYTFTGSVPTNFVLSPGCYRAQTNQVICNAASQADPFGPAIIGVTG